MADSGETPSLATIDVALARVLAMDLDAAQGEEALRDTGRAGLLRVLSLWFRDNYHPTVPFIYSGQGSGPTADGWSAALETVARANPSVFLDEVEAGRVPLDNAPGWLLAQMLPTLAVLDDPRATVWIERFLHTHDKATRFRAAKDYAVSVLFRTLLAYYAIRDDALVAACTTILCDDTPATKWLRPDVFVALGVSPRPLRVRYRLWEEKMPPVVSFDVTRDFIFQNWPKLLPGNVNVGIQEYFSCYPARAVPSGGALQSPFFGFRLVGNGYKRIAPEADGALRSEALGLLLRREEGGRLALFDARTGARLRPNDG